MTPPIALIATHSGTMRLGDADVPVHVLLSGQRVVEITAIETLIGLPESGLGAFLTTLPGGDRVRFLREADPSNPLAAREAFGLDAHKVVDMLISYRIAHGNTPAGKKAAEILRWLVRHGLRTMGQDPEAADLVMAATAPKEER